MNSSYILAEKIRDFGNKVPKHKWWTRTEGLGIVGWGNGYILIDVDKWQFYNKIVEKAAVETLVLLNSIMESIRSLFSEIEKFDDNPQIIFCRRNKILGCYFLRKPKENTEVYNFHKQRVLSIQEVEKTENDNISVFKYTYNDYTTHTIAIVGTEGFDISLNIHERLKQSNFFENI